MISPCPDRVSAVLDQLIELYDLSEKVDSLAMKLREAPSRDDLRAWRLSLQAITCRLETAAQILRSLQP
jgi:protein involved in temperature-dependent protein secretion